MAAGYLLDTNILSAGLRGEPRALLNRLAGLAPNRLHVSCIVLAELMAGAELGTRKATTLAALVDMTAGMTVLPFDTQAAAHFDDLKRLHIRIGTQDLKIAAIALANDATLITRNTQDFARISDLKFEDWSV